MKKYKSIQNRIYDLRGKRVMLDFDLAALYDVETRVLNQAVRRNLERFPKDFMFTLKPLEYSLIKNQIQELQENPSSQFVMMRNLPLNRNDKYLPLAFTEQGVAMLSGILNSTQAIKMNISIMRAFVEVRKIALTHKDIKKQISEIRKKVGIHDLQLTHLYEAIENLLSEKAAEIKWNERNRIGYKKE